MNNQHKPSKPQAEAQPLEARDLAEARLTAYALGELEGAEHAADRAVVVALLESDPAAARSVAEIRELAVVLTTDLVAEAAQAAPAAGLTAEQRRAIEAALPRETSAGATPTAFAAPAGATRGFPRWLRFVPALAAAALIAVLVWRHPLAPGEASSGANKDLGPVAANERKRPADTAETARDALSALGYLGSPRASGSSRTDGAASPVSSAPAGALLAREGATAKRAGSDSETIIEEPSSDDDLGGLTSADIQLLSALGYDGGLSGGGSSAGQQVAVVDASTSALAFGAAGAAAAAAPAPPSSASPFTYDLFGSPRGNADSDSMDTDEVDEGEAPLNALRHGLDDRNRDHGYRYFRTAPGGEGYQPIVESGFQSPLVAPRSTFSVDVDTASYANVRRFLNAGQLPPADAVRLEELINYFHYEYPQPDGEHPFSVSAEVTSCPWAESHRLVRLGLQGRTVPQAERAPSNLVFLVDVSGSMDSPDKLPLVQASLRLLVGKLDARDRIALVTYAGNAGLVLDSTSCEQKQVVLDALDRLKAGGSTAGGAGIALAYQVASQHFIKGGTNRVILATDGDFNVGATSREALQSLIETAAKSGVFLTVLGYGTGNLQDGTAELLADKGNGNYAYIDSLGEAQKVLVQQMGGTLITIAKDVKLQVEFNPGRVAAYRLLGYENRALATRDFNDDGKDAGEIGSGHSVTALYEVIPVGAADAPAPDALRYQSEAEVPAAAAPVLNDSPELLYVALRYKQPAADSSVLLGQPVIDGGERLGDTDRRAAADAGDTGTGAAGAEGATGADHGPRSAQAVADLHFVAAVAEFGMLLRHSGNAGSATWESVRALAEAGRGADRDGYRAEFLRLVGIAQSLQSPSPR